MLQSTVKLVIMGVGGIYTFRHFYGMCLDLNLVNVNVLMVDSVEMVAIESSSVNGRLRVRSGIIYANQTLQL